MGWEGSGVKKWQGSLWMVSSRIISLMWEGFIHVLTGQTFIVRFCFPQGFGSKLSFHTCGPWWKLPPENPLNTQSTGLCVYGTILPFSMFTAASSAHGEDTVLFLWLSPGWNSAAPKYVCWDLPFKDAYGAEGIWSWRSNAWGDMAVK